MKPFPLGRLLVLGALAGACGGGHDAPSLTMPTPETHGARYFPVAPKDIHGACTCSDCHSPAASTFAQFDCLSCHDASGQAHHASQADVTALHAAVASFEWSSAACYRCHPNGVGVDHVPFFPITGTAKHAGVACAECHTEPTNRKVQACAGCHGHEQATLASAHALVPDYVFGSPACLRCHGDAVVARVASHGPFRISAGAMHSGARAECLTCHPALRADAPWAADFAVFDCLGCHPKAETDQRHVGRSGYSHVSTACNRCHSTGGGGG